MAERKFAVTRNLATWDRILRVVVAVALVAFWYLGYIPADWAIALLAIAGALTVNAMMGVCGLYSLFGINTCRVPDNKVKKD